MPDFAWFLLTVIGFTVFVVWRIRARWMAFIRGVAHLHRLALEPRMLGLGLPAAVGVMNGHRVRLAPPSRPPSHHDQQTAWYTRSKREQSHAFVELRVIPARRVGVAFSPELGRLGQMLVGGDLKCGDPWFDDLVRVDGDPTAVLSMLDASARHRIGTLVEIGGRFSGGELVLAWLHEDSVPRAAEMIQLALVAVDAIQPEGTARARLARCARADEKAGVRRVMLTHLIEHHRAAPEAAESIQAGLSDADPEVRLVAARASGAGGHATLVALAAGAHPTGVRIAAIEALALTDEGLQSLSRLVADLPDQVAAAARTALKASGRITGGGLALADDRGGGLAVVTTGKRD